MGGAGAGEWLTVSSVISSDIRSGKVESNVSPASSLSIWAQWVVSMGVTSDSKWVGGDCSSLTCMGLTFVGVVGGGVRF